METINHETYCGHNLITILLKAGFDWKEYFVAHDINEHFHWEIPLHIAQRWLREVKGIYVEVISVQASDTKKLFVEYDVVIKKNGTSVWPDLCESLKSGVYPIGSHARTYEEAQETGIKKALEIILDKIE